MEINRYSVGVWFVSSKGSLCLKTYRARRVRYPELFSVPTPICCRREIAEALENGLRRN